MINRTILLKTLTFSALIVASIAAFSQEVKIINPGQLYSTYTFTTEEKDQIRKQVSAYEFDKIMKYCHEDMWPVGIHNLDAWTKHKEDMKLYKVYKVANVGEKCVLIAPSAENQFMSYEMKPATDIYFIMGQSAIEAKTTGTVYQDRNDRPTSNTITNGTPVHITATGGLYSTFDLVNSVDAERIRAQVGAEFDDIVVYCKESNWPAGISNLDARERVREQINNYKAYSIARFGEKCILRIPAAENKFMPYDMRPKHDIYFVITQKNVEAGSAVEAANNIPDTHNTTERKKVAGVPAVVTGTGGMYSGYTLATDASAEYIRSQVGAEFDDIAVYCRDEKWPTGISSFSKRDQVRQKMLDYKAYKIAEFDGKYILRIPAAENKFMPYDMQPTHDIYFIINTDNVSLNARVVEGGSDFRNIDEEDVEPATNGNPKPIKLSTPAPKY